MIVDRPLASNFKLGDGQVNATVFDVPTRSTYIVVCTSLFTISIMLFADQTYDDVSVR